ncbi:MAG: YitT family protein [Oscillospiraceae bacterium]|nr:YitT family protein [Oscillospiraceae bacterium]
MKAKFKEYSLITFATLMVSVGVYFFKFPNHFSTGGVTGISILLAPFIPALSPGALVFIINMGLLLVGFLIFGRGFGLKTAYASTLMSVSTWALEKILPLEQPLTDEPLLELMFAVTLPAIGSALLFNVNASTGGTDVVAMILKKYTNLNIGHALFCSDVLITVSTCFVFGIKAGLYSILGLLMKSMLVDSVIENINLCKYFTIVTVKADEIIDYITHELHRGATVQDGEGAFHHEPKKVILTVLNRTQAVHLRQFARKVDPHAFIMITNSSEIIGKGFRGQ